MLEMGFGVAKDPSAALRWYLLAARQGHAMAQYYVGTLFEQGQGTDVDLLLARQWYAASAAQDNGYAHLAPARLARR